jgi:hypothetical protein
MSKKLVILNDGLLHRRIVAALEERHEDAIEETLSVKTDVGVTDINQDSCSQQI